MRVAQEENFLFSYNITSLTAGMRRALNRERTNVGREAYSERVKAILLACQSTVVADAIAQDLEKQQSGRQHDELSWVDVAIHGCRLLNATGKVVFVTTEQTVSSPHVIDQIRSEGLRLIVIPETIHERIVGKVDVNGNSVRDLGEYVSFYNSSFKFRFVDRDGLRPYEVDIFDRTSDILSLVCCSARKSSLRSRYSV